MGARLGFSIASAVNPEILLIDEVLSVGDQDFRKRSLNKILEMVEGSRTVVIVSHNFNTLLGICNRMILVDAGQIKAAGEPQEVVAAYSKLKKYI
jgi:ABC-type polysaccharide/polyol phosphate transport system ATPase subunit